ncbi:MAG: V-type ATP synthase subunit E [Candidatus Micrarchaeota archaeon]|nr:V-type ATP synthase subunit E [Candidatus Micrarchaeota archaeon]
MPLEEIKHEIEQDARKEARRIAEESRKECDQIASEARARARAITDQSEASIKAELDLLNREYDSSTELGRKSAILSAMEEALEAEMRSIRKELVRRARSSPAYPTMFKDAMRAARQMSSEGNYVIQVAKKDVPLLGKTDGKIETREMDGGLMIYSPDRSMSIDATLDKLIDSSEERIRGVINSRLFAQVKRAKKAATKPRKIAAKRASKPRQAKKTVKGRKK